MPFKTCNHVKENGTFCRSAALRGRDYCYFHLRLRGRRLGMAQAQSRRAPWGLDLPPLEDMHSVQVALMQVLDALAAGHLDHRRAGLLLYGLQQAATNLKSVSGWLNASRFEVKHEDDCRADSYPGLETEFGLPKHLDIDTPPEVAFPPPATEPAAATPGEALQEPTAAAAEPVDEVAASTRSKKSAASTRKTLTTHTPGNAATYRLKKPVANVKLEIDDDCRLARTSRSR
jgi:hypothetical protein